jgi:hypothetical protein
MIPLGWGGWVFQIDVKHYFLKLGDVKERMQYSGSSIIHKPDRAATGNGKSRRVN